MLPFFLYPEVEAVRSKIAAKQNEYANAIRSGKEFEYTKKIYLEIKQLIDDCNFLTGEHAVAE